MSTAAENQPWPLKVIAFIFLSGLACVVLFSFAYNWFEFSSYWPEQRVMALLLKIPTFLLIGMACGLCLLISAIFNKVHGAKNQYKKPDGIWPIVYPTLEIAISVLTLLCISVFFDSLFFVLIFRL